MVKRKKEKMIPAGKKARRKAAEARKKRIEKKVDRILIGGCLLITLLAALAEVKENK